MRKSLLIISFLVSAFLVSFGSNPKSVTSTRAAQQSCTWELVNTKEAITTGSYEDATAYRNGNSIITAQTQSGNEVCDAQTFQTTHTWTDPGTSLIPGQEINFSVSVAWELIGPRQCSSLTAGVQTYVAAGDTTIRAAQDHIAVSKEPSGSVSGSGTWTVPTGSTVGAKMNIRAMGDGGGIGGTVTYFYEYTCASTPVPPTESPTETSLPATPTPELAAYRLSAKPRLATDPLNLGFQLEKREPDSQDGAYAPVEGAILKIQALSYASNENALADEFVASSCQNCTSRDAGGQVLYRLNDTTQPIELETDGAGGAQLGLFLDFATLGNRIPQAGEPLLIPVAVEAWVTEAGQEQKVAELQDNLSLNAIAVVLAVTYEGPQMYDLGDSPLPKVAGPLDSYYDDPGTRDGPRTLSGGNRVLIERPGEAGISATGSTPGTQLMAGNLLHVGDRVTINACDMVTNRIVDGLPAGAPGVIWVKVRFFDGLKAKVGVNGSVCRSAVVFGQSPGSSGWLSSGDKFFYWTANGTMNYIIGSYLWPYKIVSGMNTAGKFLAWVWGNEAAGWSPVYIKVQSAFTVEFDENGAMQLTTLEGEPVILTQSTGEEGISVPVGNTAHVQDALDVSVEETNPETAQLAQAKLDSLDQDESQSVTLEPTSSEAEPAADLPPVSSVEPATHSSAPSRSVLLTVGLVICCCGVLTALVLVILYLLYRRSRR